MPPKIRDLITDLTRAGFKIRGGKGRYRNFIHDNLIISITISGNNGDDAKYYQVKAVRTAIEESKK